MLASVVLTESVNVPHWFPRCSGCGWLGPDYGTTQPTEPYVCGGCGGTGDAWHIRFRPTLRRAPDGG